MNVSKEPFQTVINNIHTSKNYPLTIQKWIETTDEQQHLIQEIKQHFTLLENTTDVYSLFLKWTDANNAYWGNILALTAVLFQDLFYKQRTTSSTINTSYHITEPTVIYGDLTIDGDLNINYINNNALGLIVLGNLTIKGNYVFDGSSLIVLGNLNVEGYIQEQGDWSLTIVTGDCIVKQFINSSGELFVYGRTYSPFIYVSYNHGHALFNNGFSALYFHESDHGRSYSFGSNDASFIMLDEMHGVEQLEDKQNYANLKHIISNAYLGDWATADLEHYDQDEFGDVAEFLEEEYEFEISEFSYELLEPLSQGEAVFNPELLEAWIKANF